MENSFQRTILIVKTIKSFQKKMQTQDFIKFIENLSVIKDLDLKSKMIHEEINKLDSMLRELDYSNSTSKLEKLTKQTEYFELQSYKNVLAFRLSLLQSNIQNK